MGSHGIFRCQPLDTFLHRGNLLWQYVTPFIRHNYPFYGPHKMVGSWGHISIYPPVGVLISMKQFNQYYNKDTKLSTLGRLPYKFLDTPDYSEPGVVGRDPLVGVWVAAIPS